MPKHHSLNYVEYGANDLEATKAFFEATFGWKFQDYGPDYTAFSQAELDGGFFRAPVASRTDSGGALLVFYSEDLQATQALVENSGGQVVKPVFEFPGGRRFHFCEPSGNEFAVWSDK